MANILLHTKINAELNECMWVSMRMEHLSHRSNNRGTRLTGGLWVSAEISLANGNFTPTRYNDYSGVSGAGTVLTAAYLTPEKEKRYLFFYNGALYSEGYEQNSKKPEKIACFRYLNADGFTCEAKITECDNFSNVISMPYAVLLTASGKIKITDSLYMNVSEKLQAVNINFNNPASSAVTYKTADDTELILNIASDGFCVSPKNNPAYKSKVNTIKYWGAFTSGAAQELCTAMVIPCKK